MLSLDGLSDDVARFSKGCECLLSALARDSRFSETEKAMISYYCEELMTQTQSLRDEYENR
jgi:hypothetical protein